MGQSLVKNYIHITFSTKNRNNLITEDIEEELYNYIGGICKNTEKKWFSSLENHYILSKDFWCFGFLRKASLRKIIVLAIYLHMLIFKIINKYLLN